MAPQPVNAATITVTLPEFSYNPFLDPSFTGYPAPEQLVGTFNYPLPLGDEIVAASLSGTFGNSVVPNSAPLNVFLDGLLMAQCLEGDTCTLVSTPESWEYNFTPLSFLLLADGTADLTSIQTADSITRLGETTLRITTRPREATAVPGPLPVLGAAAAFGYSRKLRKCMSRSKTMPVDSAIG